MVTKQPRPLRFHPEALQELVALQAESPDVAQVAWSVAKEVTLGQRRGKALGTRESSGDLVGLLRIKFDLPNTRPEKYRLLYEDTDDGVVMVWAIGLREQRTIYRQVVARWEERE